MSEGIYHLSHPMKPNRILATGLLTGLLLCCSRDVAAEEKVPCLIFTGNSETEHCIDLSKLNRITFGDDGMTVSSSTGDSTEKVKLLYSLFNRIKIDDAVPTESAGLDEVEIDADSRMVFQRDTKSIVIESPSDLPYSIGIFSLNGSLIAMSTANAGQSLSVEALTTGAYIAVATNGDSKLTLKFIIN